MILHLSEITKGMRQDVVRDYTSNLKKYSNYFVNAVHVSSCIYLKKKIVDPSSAVTVMQERN